MTSESTKPGTKAAETTAEGLIIVVPPRQNICTACGIASDRVTVVCQTCLVAVFCAAPTCSRSAREHHVASGFCFDWAETVESLGKVHSIAEGCRSMGQLWLSQWKVPLMAWTLFAFDLANGSPNLVRTHSFFVGLWLKEHMVDAASAMQVVIAEIIADAELEDMLENIPLKNAEGVSNLPVRAVGATGPANIYLSVAGVHVEFSVDWSDLFQLVDETRMVDKDVGRLLRAHWPATFMEQVAAGDVHGWRRLLSTAEDAVAGRAGVAYQPAVSVGPAPTRIAVPPRTSICASVLHSAPGPTAHVPCERCRSVFYCSGRCASLDRERHCSEEEGTCFDSLALIRARG
ncbi:hypothetical protein B0H14DRAFT_2903766 [Mycena olivaceomarginata]|nr:hypothetical protein B0H14DRAFT_2903766 [Mycena olivaceomarginata]